MQNNIRLEQLKKQATQVKTANKNTVKTKMRFPDINSIHIYKHKIIPFNLIPYKGKTIPRVYLRFLKPKLNSFMFRQHKYFSLPY